MSTVPNMPGLPSGPGDPFDWRNWPATSYTVQAPWDSEQPIKAAAMVVRELAAALAQLPSDSTEAAAIRSAIRVVTKYIRESYKR